MRTFLILAMLTGAATMAMAQGKTIPPPDDVKAAPADAKKTSSGLTYKVVTPGR
jgi:hypothetical protein